MHVMIEKILSQSTGCHLCTLWVAHRSLPPGGGTRSVDSIVGLLARARPQMGAPLGVISASPSMSIESEVPYHLA